MRWTNYGSKTLSLPQGSFSSPCSPATATDDTRRVPKLKAWIIAALAIALACSTTTASRKYNIEKHRLIITPAGWRSQKSLGEYSCSYLKWGTLKSEGIQLQHGQTTPALAVVEGRLTVVYNQPQRYYPHASFWLSAGPELVKHGKSVPFNQWRRSFPTLDANRRTHRVALCVRNQQFWFVYRYGTLLELQRECLRSGAEHALNLDGGSCVVYREGKMRMKGEKAQLQVTVLPR